MTRRGRIVTCLAALAGLAALGACDRGGSSGGGPEPDAPPAKPEGPAIVKVAPGLVDAGRLRSARVSRRAAAGSVRLAADVVASPEGAAEAGTLVAGRVASFAAREGDRVERGQVLAWLDSPEAARAVADAIRARARTETQARKVTRLEGLVASEAATALALDEARLELELARADLAAARTLLASLGVAEPAASAGGALTVRLPVRSPVDGVVVERTAPLGAHVRPETHLFRLVSEGRVLIEARVPEGSSTSLAPTSVAHVQPRGGSRCTARMLGVLPQVDAPTRSKRARFAPGAECAGLVAGAQVEVEVEVAAGTSDGVVLTAPAVAIVEMKTSSFVFVPSGAAGTFEARPIEPGLRLGDDVVVRAGLVEGEEVVVEGAVLLKGEVMRAELGGEE
ncbi:MAG: efflux RND transporter periplasmic adaptor subunit [Labilithrix sp.]|nr:efflux RND transporter periplasmic adaptor subunit [Labilithrix sp.]